MEKTERELLYAGRLSAMLRLETVSRPGEAPGASFDEFRALLEALFPLLNQTCRKQELGGSLLYIWAGRDTSRAVAFMSHHDVVEAGGEWTYPPFAGEIADGKIWGRGALDVKGNLFCMLQAAEELMAEGFVPPCNICFITSCMEEIGGNTLVADYLLSEGMRLDLLLDEGTPLCHGLYGAEGLYAMVSVAEKGYADIRLTARSPGGHSSAPERGSPLVRLGAFMKEIEDAALFELHMTAATEEMYRRLSANTPGERGEALREIGRLRPQWETLLTRPEQLVLQSTIAFTMAQGSGGCNVIPSEAWIVANLRVIPGETVAGTIDRLRPLAARYGLSIDTIKSNEPSAVTDYGSDAFVRIERAVSAIWPEAITVPFIMSGGTDTKHFTRVCECCLRFTPLLVSEAQQGAVHGVDENIDIAALPGAIDFYKVMYKGEGGGPQ